MRGARRTSVDEHPEPDCPALHRRPHDEMEVAGVKAVADLPTALGQHNGLRPLGPLALEGPYGPEALGPLDSEVVLRRPQVAPVGGRFRPPPFLRHQVAGDVPAPGLGQQLLDDPFRFRVAALDRKSTRLNSSHGYISYAVFCLKKK